MTQLQQDKSRQFGRSAYHLWVLAGRPPGREAEFRQFAEREPPQGQPELLNDDLDLAGENSMRATDPVDRT